MMMMIMIFQFFVLKIFTTCVVSSVLHFDFTFFLKVNVIVNSNGKFVSQVESYLQVARHSLAYYT